MNEHLVNLILQKIDQAAELYYRLIVVAAISGSGKTAALQKVQRDLNVPFVNVNLELSRLMLDLTQQQRTLYVPKLLKQAIAQYDSDIFLLDNIEILFDITLKQDPLRLLEHLSRNKTIVAAWNGIVTEGKLIYGEANHPEYRKYPVRDFLVVTP